MSKSDNEKMKEEHNAIRYFSKTLDRTFIASRANEKLNRYINIYPYDSTRVVLNDDEFENDYINASYINVSRKVTNVFIFNNFMTFVGILLSKRIHSCTRTKTRNSIGFLENGYTASNRVNSDAYITGRKQ